MTEEGVGTGTGTVWAVAVVVVLGELVTETGSNPIVEVVAAVEHGVGAIVISDAGAARSETGLRTVEDVAMGARGSIGEAVAVVEVGIKGTTRFRPEPD